jgi:hypothetical protein
VADHHRTDPGPSAATPGSGWRRVLRSLSRLRRPSRRVRSLLLLVAGTGVLIGVVLSARGLDLRLSDLRWAPLLVAAVLATPATIALNALELRVMAATVAATDAPRLSWLGATRATVLATAANLLPLPAGALIRIQAVRSVGASTARATTVNLAGAGAWVGAGLLLAGLAAVGTSTTLALTGVAIGLAAIAVAAAMVQRVATSAWVSWAARLGAVELATVVVHGLRLWLVLLGLDVAADLRQALVLGAAAPLAAAAGVFPSGLGLAEVLTALLAPVAQLPEAAGFLATAVGRVIGLVVTAPIALALGLREAVGRAREASPADPDDDQSSA